MHIFFILHPFDLPISFKCFVCCLRLFQEKKNCTIFVVVSVVAIAVQLCYLLWNTSQSFQRHETFSVDDVAADVDFAAARWINKRAMLNATGTPKHISCIYTSHVF